MDKNGMKALLDEKTDVRKHLFEKGFLITDEDINGLDKYPFYGNWCITKVGKYNFYTYH